MQGTLENVACGWRPETLGNMVRYGRWVPLVGMKVPDGVASHVMVDSAPPPQNEWTLSFLEILASTERDLEHLARDHQRVGAWLMTSLRGCLFFGKQTQRHLTAITRDNRTGQGTAEGPRLRSRVLNSITADSAASRSSEYVSQLQARLFLFPDAKTPSMMQSRARRAT
jgi:hypothetical protein